MLHEQMSPRLARPARAAHEQHVIGARLVGQALELTAQRLAIEKDVIGREQGRLEQIGRIDDRANGGMNGTELAVGEQLLAEFLRQLRHGQQVDDLFPREVRREPRRQRALAAGRLIDDGDSLGQILSRRQRL